MKEAMLYEKLDKGEVKCILCGHRCLIKDGKKGICAVRENRGGILYTLVYGKVIARHIDPIEKKPLFHFHPGSTSYSIATVGCNLRCFHCQNYEISQYPKKSYELRVKSYERNSELQTLNSEPKSIPGEDITPEDIVNLAIKTGCLSISYTYTEPTIFFELAYDTAILAKKKGIKNVFVSNGYTSPEATKMITPYLDANNIDLKSFRDEHYRRVCGAKLQPVLDTIRLMKESGVWVEVTTLIIPSGNDSEEELRDIAGFIKSVSIDIPWHVTQFYPTYKLLEQPRTPIKTLRRAREIGLEVGLRYVYEGNVPGEGGESTYCYNCKMLLIDRYNYLIRGNYIKESKCPNCGSVISGVGL
ncbi:MAG: AmmeMemoRadiSam system radical SAM enzyme [Nitrospirae bacterium]|nr:AmmeMemoRadiSam system radical SAM enzyme [Nitrospirota bacterium]